MKKILIVPILLISFFMVLDNVSALAISSGVFQSNTCNTSSSPSDNCSINVNNSTSFSGYMIFSYNIVFNGPHYTLSQVYLDTTTGPVACEIGSLSGFRDSGVQEYTDYGKCPITNGMTINKVVFRFANTASSIFYVNAGLYYTFVDDGNSDVISAIIAQTNSINGHIDSASSSIALAIASGVNSINDRQLTDKNEILTAITNQTNNINGRIDLFRNELGQSVLNIMSTISSSSSSTNTAINNQSAQQHSDSQAEQNAINDNTQAVNDLNNTISDSNVSGNGADDFFNNFQDNDHGLSSVVTAPLNFIRSLASSSCSSISLTIPYVDTQFNLPCMSTIYRQNFGSLFTLYQTITFGIVAYYVCIKIYGIVKGFKNPDNDRIEVLEL